MNVDSMVTQVHRNGAERYDERVAKTFYFATDNMTPEQLEQFKRDFATATVPSDKIQEITVTGALPDVLGNSDFQMQICVVDPSDAATSDIADEIRKEYLLLSPIIQKYTLDDNQLTVTFVETQTFIVNRLLLSRPNDRFSVSLYLYDRRGIGGVSYLKGWIFHQPRLVKIGGNAGQSGVQTLTVQFTLKHRG